MTPQVQQDERGHFYVDATGQRFNAVNGTWIADVAPAPAPVAPPVQAAPMPPTAFEQNQAAATAAVAMPQPAPQMQAAGLPQAAPVMAAPMTMPQPSMVMPGAAAPGLGMPGPGGAGPNLFEDMSNVSDDAFRTIPEGTTVEAIISEIEVEQSKTDNQHMLKLTLITCFPEQYKGIKIWEYIKMDDKSRWKFKRLCRVTNKLDPTGSRFIGTSHMDFKNEVIRFNIRNDEYNGVPTNKVAGSYEQAHQTPGLQGVPTQSMPQAAAVPGAPVYQQPGIPQMPNAVPQQMPGVMQPNPAWPVPGQPVQ